MLFLKLPSLNRKILRQWGVNNKLGGLPRWKKNLTPTAVIAASYYPLTEARKLRTISSWAFRQEKGGHEGMRGTTSRCCKKYILRCHAFLVCIRTALSSMREMLLCGKSAQCYRSKRAAGENGITAGGGNLPMQEQWMAGQRIPGIWHRFQAIWLQGQGFGGITCHGMCCWLQKSQSTALRDVFIHRRRQFAGCLPQSVQVEDGRPAEVHPQGRARQHCGPFRWNIF